MAARRSLEPQMKVQILRAVPLFPDMRKATHRQSNITRPPVYATDGLYLYINIELSAERYAHAILAKPPDAAAWIPKPLNAVIRFTAYLIAAALICRTHFAPPFQLPEPAATTAATSPAAPAPAASPTTAAPPTGIPTAHYPSPPFVGDQYIIWHFNHACQYGVTEFVELRIASAVRFLIVSAKFRDELFDFGCRGCSENRAFSLKFSSCSGRRSRGKRT